MNSPKEPLLGKDSLFPLVDAHTHLEEIENLNDALARAESAGILAVVTVGSDYASCRRALEISGAYGRTMVYPALGIHPWSIKVDEVDATLRFIEENMNRAVAVGEIGLDYWLKGASKDASHVRLQQDVFGKLLALSKKHEKPAIIHARGSWDDCLRLATESGVEKAVFHWYSGSPDTLRQILDQGYFISATPAAGYSKNHEKAVFDAPLASLLLETDAPVEYKGKRSEPSDVVATMEAVARTKGESTQRVATITTQNALKFFSLAG
jgi:TatD DNase family protein